MENDAMTRTLVGEGDSVMHSGGRKARRDLRPVRWELRKGMVWMVSEAARVSVERCFR